MKMISPLSIILLAFLLFSCSESENSSSEETLNLLKNVEKSLAKIQTVSYKTSYKFYSTTSSDTMQSTMKVTLERMPKDSEIHAKLLLDFGVVKISYDGLEYRALSEMDKEVLFAPANEGGKDMIYQNTIANSMHFIINNADSAYTVFQHTTDSIKIYDGALKTTNNVGVEFIKTIAQYNAKVIGIILVNKDTYLPELYKEYNVIGADTNVTEFHFSDFVINPKIDKAIFKINPPEGYTLKKQEPKTTAANTQTAPDFELKTNGNKTVSLSKLKGKVVLIDFWGTWCVWCERTAPLINKVYEKYKSKGVEVLGISCGEPENADPIEYAKKKNMAYKILLNGDETANKYQVQGFPTFVLIDKKGEISFVYSGYDEKLDEILSEKIEQLLK